MLRSDAIDLRPPGRNHMRTNQRSNFCVVYAYIPIYIYIYIYTLLYVHIYPAQKKKKKKKKKNVYRLLLVLAVPTHVCTVAKTTAAKTMHMAVTGHIMATSLRVLLCDL